MKIKDKSIELSILLLAISLIGLGFVAGYSLKSAKDMSEKKDYIHKNELNNIKELYYLKGGKKMLELKNSPYNTHKINDNFYKEFKKEFENDSTKTNI